jgi:hypothetical protein
VHICTYWVPSCLDSCGSLANVDVQFAKKLQEIDGRYILRKLNVREHNICNPNNKVSIKIELAFCQSIDWFWARSVQAQREF